MPDFYTRSSPSVRHSSIISETGSAVIPQRIGNLPSSPPRGCHRTHRPRQRHVLPELQVAAIRPGSWPPGKLPRSPTSARALWRPSILPAGLEEYNRSWGVCLSKHQQLLGLDVNSGSREVRIILSVIINEPNGFWGSLLPAQVGRRRLRRSSGPRQGGSRPSSTPPQVRVFPKQDFGRQICDSYFSPEYCRRVTW